jgi:DEAD/DEAH box helicase domain-containing protein
MEMDKSAFLHHLTTLPFYGDQIAHIESISPSEPSHGELDSPLHPRLYDRLNSVGLLPLYSHQAAAVNAARKGENVMVVAPSAGGKTLCYHLLTLEAMLGERETCALYLFPTKALAQDQLRVLQELACPDLLREKDCAIFDGDTPSSQRPVIKRSVRVVLTNPDMLHLGILPNHPSWARLLRRLRYVVIDESHIYRGVFGSHVACVLRRLRRLCALYGSRPQFICCSATIANPEEHARRLVGLPFEVIRNGSPRGGKDFIFWNPPIIDIAKGMRRSANTEATALFTELIRHGIRSITFTRTRKLTELIYIYSRDQLARSSPDLAERIKPYRAGYLPEERRLIEQDLFQGGLLGVVATTALELGVDIGDLEATVLTGYPGSIAATWQQAGRSGRRSDKSLSFLVALDTPLDQYFMRHPESFFQASFENALVNPDNPYILKPHLLCAAWEKPLGGDDEELFGSEIGQAITELEGQGLLRSRGERCYLSPGVAYPAQGINIRSTRGERYTIVDASRSFELLETVEASVALSQIHPGAVYLHQGEPYLVTELDLASNTAYVMPTAQPYYTQTKEITDLRIVRTLWQKISGGTMVHFGKVEVTTIVVGFKKKMQFTEEVVGEEPLDLPAQCFDTMALWFDIPAKAEDEIAEKGLDLAGGLHAAEHATIAMLPLFALCDRNDIGGVSTPLHPDTGRAQIFIHDAYPGGTGLAEKGFELVAELWQTTLKAIVECPCGGGCPSCIQSPKCGNNNEPLDKEAAQIILERLSSNVSLPTQPPS